MNDRDRRESGRLMLISPERVFYAGLLGRPRKRTSGGTNIYPREVEEVLLRHPGVLEVSVIGRPHRDWGEEVVACVVARPQHTVSAIELDALCLSAIARFKRPRGYVFLDTLPKNNYGKVLKTELRKLHGTLSGAE